MFKQRTNAAPPPNGPEPTGVKLEVRLTEEALLKLLPWMTALLVGGGIVGAGWQVRQTQTSIPASTPNPPEVIQPQK